MGKHGNDISVEMMGLTNQLRRNADAITARYGGARFTGMQSFILSYIYDCGEEGQDVFQRDVEKEFYISRSTASGILSLMEKNGLIRRCSVPQDARLKKLVPTEKGAQIINAIRTDLDGMDDAVYNALTPEEQEQMHIFLEKLWQAMEEVSRSLGLEPVNRDRKRPPIPPQECSSELPQ